MKKHEVVDRLDRAGNAINDLNATAWNTALNPTRHGWASSIFSAATIPILSAASIGQLVSSAVVKQISPGVVERLTGERKDQGGEGGEGQGGQGGQSGPGGQSG